MLDLEPAQAREARPRRELARVRLVEPERAEARARELARAAGFARFERLDVEHPVNAFYTAWPT